MLKLGRFFTLLFLLVAVTASANVPHTFGSSVVTTNDYFANSKRLRQMVTRNSTSALQNLAYTYDQVSNLKSIADAVYTNTASASLTNLAYDDLHRLTALTRPAVSQTTTFGYDSIGNVLTNGEFGTGAYNYGLRMPHAVKSANETNYAYDMNGNMLVRGNQRLAYVVTASGYSMFGYDAGGSRLWKQSSGTNTLQVWIGGNYEEKNGQTLFHVPAGDQTICMFDKTGTNVFAYYHPDHLHSTAIETDKNGNRAQHYEYTVFGQDRFTESATVFPVSRRYISQVKDEDTGHYYYGARYYDPQLERFIQADTVIASLANPQHLNHYSYTLNNPLKYTDPNGHQPVEAEPEGEITREIRMELRNSLRSDGTQRPLTSEQRMESRAEKEFAAQGMRMKGLNPAQEYIGAAEPEFRPPTGKELADYAEQRPESIQPNSMRGGIGPVNKGKIVEAMSEAEAIAAGETIRGRQVTFQLPSGARTRPDLLTETAEGALKTRESKNGPGAKLTSGQTELKQVIQNGGTVVPVGARAKQAGLEAGKQTHINHFEEDRH